MARQSRKSFMRELMHIRNSKPGDPPYQSWGTRELERLRREGPRLPPLQARSEPPREVLRGYMIAAVYEQPDGRQVVRPLDDLHSVKHLVQYWSDILSKENADRERTDRRPN